MKNIVRNIQNTAHIYALWKKRDSFVVGVSGGSDSVCLLDILHTLAPKYDFSLHIAHVNYKLRGHDSDEDEVYVRSLSEQYGIPLTVYVPQLSHAKPSEALLRSIRYNFFEQLRSKLHYSAIAVGHTVNDQAETVLLHIIRGCGLNGLSGMRPKHKNIIRPLIETAREDILHYLSKRKIAYKTDATNLEPIYTRNSIRNTLLPMLATINPNIVESLATLAENASIDYRYIKNIAQNAVAITKEKNTPLYTFSLHEFLSLDEALQNEFLRQICAISKKNTETASFKHIREIKKMLKSTKNKTHVLEIQKLNFSRKNDTVSIMIKQS